MVFSRRRFLAGCAGAASARAATPRPPNILIITADNLGFHDTGCYGNRGIKTPNLDRLAGQGIRFTNFCTASPTCTVSRSSLLTGRYPQRVGLNHQLSVEENRSGVGIPHGEKLLPQYLKPHGYATACFGKWNIGFAPGSRPTERGFDEFLGLRSGNFDYFDHIYAGEHDLYRDSEPAHLNGYCTDLFADAACDFLRRKAKQPFLLYLAFNAPHYNSARNMKPGKPVVVWQAPDRYFDLYGYHPDTEDQPQRYRAVVTALDDGIGRVLRQVDSLGLAGDTLVFFYSDNGAFMMQDRGLGVASNKPLREGGATLWEGGIRVAALARWPGRFRVGAVSDEPLISLDLLPMFLNAAGVPLPNDRILDGRDPVAALRGETAPAPRDLFFEYGKFSAVRSGRHKIIRTAPGQPWELYDLAADIGETRNLAGEKPGIVAGMGNKFDAWIRQFPKAGS